MRITTALRPREAATKRNTPLVPASNFPNLEFRCFFSLHGMFDYLAVDALAGPVLALECTIFRKQITGSLHSLHPGVDGPLI